MTCIVGIVHDGMVTIGGDSAATNSSGQLVIRVDPKVFKRGEFIFGCGSSVRMAHLLRYSLEIPALPALDHAEALEKYLMTVFIDAVRMCFKDGGYAEKENERESGGTFLIGVQGRLFRVESDY